MNSPRVLVMDFGSQYVNLIARRVRELRVHCEIVPHSLSAEEMARTLPSAIIMSGGPASVYEQTAPKCDPGIFDLEIPVLGICYGMQLAVMALGGEVRRAERREYGPAEVELDPECQLFDGVPSPTSVWMSHGDSVASLPPGFRVAARSANTPVAAIEDPQRRIYGVQFHPEVVHTAHGREILANFLLRISGLPGDWTPGSFIEETIAAIRRQIGDDRAVCALSGGVDSSVAALLTARAIGDRLTCIFVNHGLLRKGEPEEVEKVFRGHFHLNLVVVDARERFLSRLAGIEDPEAKRRVIGEEFIRVFEEEAARLGDLRFLVQGTLYPDVIESTAKDTGPAAKIKTHHNVGGLPEDLKFELVEPLRLLFKDEVRLIGAELGLPDTILGRHPFPGPGLAVRALGEVTAERIEILREADAIVTEEISRAGLYSDVWQAFAVLPTGRSVGVMGDGRTYSYFVVVRAVVSEDGMTADWARLPHSVLERISSRIVNEVAGVNRVVYDITSKPPATIEWE
ncbi:MAG: glutamine-hydrolyzing GMP synthase [Firmicutes bacterium]|jgi:GMP synthase (glutamine-hydrolysing)|nr:glutamine-hydrolyzing GMP synthase [Bacillota bacterium]